MYTCTLGKLAGKENINAAEDERKMRIDSNRVLRSENCVVVASG